MIPRLSFYFSVSLQLEIYWFFIFYDSGKSNGVQIMVVRTGSTNGKKQEISLHFGIPEFILMSFIKISARI